MKPVDPIAAALLIFGGFLLRSGIDALLEWLANRPRRFNLGRDYFDPCGPQCKAKKMSRVGDRVRSEEDVDAAAARFHRRVTTGSGTN